MEGAVVSAWERVQTYGIRAAGVRDLLALCLSREVKDVPLNEKAADELLKVYQASRIAEISRADLMNAAGLEGMEADRILAAIELGRKCGLTAPGKNAEIMNDEDAYQLFRSRLHGAWEERFLAAFLTAKSEVIHVATMHVGTLTATVVGAREIYREALRHNAASVIVSHNHPSGDPEPSPEDISITRTLKQAGDLMDVQLLDHIIVGRDTYVSLKRRGYL